MRHGLSAAFFALAAALAATAAQAAQPVDWQLGFQPAASAIMEQVRWFNDYTLWFIVPITLLVLGLLLVVFVRFRASANPVPSKTSHNTLIEVIWTVGPVVVLLFLAVPSFQLLTAQYTPPSEPEMTVKAVGYQWYWGYEYQDDSEVAFESFMLQEDDRADYGKTDAADYPRLLAVDSEMVVPVDTTVRLLVTAADVLHSFAMPAFGIKVDAVPGRLNETWFRAEAEGLYYGQCSELCGQNHAYMPIAIRVVSRDQYDAWVASAADDVNEANRELMAALQASEVTVDLAERAE